MKKADAGAAKRERLKRLALLSSMKALTTADQTWLRNFKFPTSPPLEPDLGVALDFLAKLCLG